LARAHHRDRIVRPGFVSDQTRADLLTGASVFAYPSRYEGFGLPPLEAMTAATPVVATRAGALPEVLGDAAVFVDPGDTEGLTGALANLLTSSPRRDSLIDRGRKRAARYSWDACAEGVVHLYQHLC
jgi:glycosyltransferase involved in cell wall biosynthesis